MPLEQTADGLQIQPVEEIISETQTAFRDPATGFGAGVRVEPNTGFGQFIATESEREALLQQNLQRIQSKFDPATAEGTDLDVICGYTATIRRGETQSASGSGYLTGTPGTVIPEGNRVQNVETGDIWTIAGGAPGYTIPGGGGIACSLLAQETGPITFLTATTWTIVDTVSGWATFATTADIDPEDTGDNIETDAELRQRRIDELFAGGNDLSGIKANVSKVVDEVAVYENLDPVNVSPDGIPGGALETVVEGGEDTAVAQAILDRKPPGAEAYGQSVYKILSDQDGNPISIGFTRVADVNIWISIIVNVGAAETPLPDNVYTLIAQAALDHGNANARIGQDSIPETFNGALFEVVKNQETGVYGAESFDIEVGLTASTANAPIPIDIRSRADYDSARIAVDIH